MDGDPVQLAKPFRLRRVLLDEQSVQILQVGQAHELRHIRIVTDIAFPARVLNPSNSTGLKSGLFNLNRGRNLGTLIRDVH